MSKESSSSSGIGFTGLLTVAFIVLKLTEVIDWSWWWVLSPVWISFILIAIITFFEVKESRENQLNKTLPPMEGTQSKFMQKLEEAIKASEEARKTKQN